MTEFNNTAAADALIISELREKLAERTVEMAEARAKRDQALADLQAVRGQFSTLKAALQQDLASFAEGYLDSGDEAAYRELNELMQSNGLDGLKRSFSVTVRVTYEFEVEVEASDEDEARDEVDNNLTSYAQDNVYSWDTPDDYDIEVSEA